VKDPAKRGDRICTVAAGLSGLLMASAYAPLEWSLAGWLCFLPLTVTWVWFCPKTRHGLRGLVLGCAFFFPTLFWVTEVSWLGWIALSALMAGYPALWLWSAGPVLAGAGARLTSLANLGRASVLAASWVGTEFLRGWLFTGFSWNFLGVSQARMVAVIQVAEWGGVLLVSWLVLFGSVILGLTTVRVWREAVGQQRMKPHFEFTLGMLVLGIVLLYGIHSLFKKDVAVDSLKVVAVQPDIPQDPWGPGTASEEVVARMEVLSLSGLAEATEAVDLVVWPETPVGRELYSSGYFKEAWSAITIDRQVSLMMGSIVNAGPDLYNAAFYFPAGGGAPQVYYKNHLVLMGETVPIPDWMPFREALVPLPRNFSRGTSAPVFQLSDSEIRAAPLICFEDTFGRIPRRFLAGEPDILINITNDGWFGRSSQSRQHLANALFRAVENRMPLLRVSNNGVTCLIDHKGILQPETLLGNWEDSSLHDPGVLITSVPIPENQTTLYQRLGDWPGIPGLLSLLGLTLRRVWRKEKPLPESPSSV